ncbi:YtxH domain-containing protein [Bacillus alveayuensis]|jgi:gas vesicle protein|uniref:YtxH domain-containing protein n=1 Tax=Aeribacillus alveayuensis TaxID=279215 RepID=UPI0005D10F64|nr:YtxH domain-containing protein [Bacillus alveayuensis]
MSRSKSFLLGMVVGGAISGVVSLLSTPSSGKELRNRLNENYKKINDLLTELKNEGSSLKEQITNCAKESIHVVKEVSSDLNQSILAWKKEIEPHKQEIKRELHEIEEKIKELENSLKQ